MKIIITVQAEVFNTNMNKCMLSFKDYKMFEDKGPSLSRVHFPKY